MEPPAPHAQIGETTIKEIKAIIQPFMLDAVLDALHEIEGLPGVTVSEARDVSVKLGHYEQVVKAKPEVK